MFWCSEARRKTTIRVLCGFQSMWSVNTGVFNGAEGSRFSSSVVFVYMWVHVSICVVRTAWGFGESNLFILHLFPSGSDGGCASSEANYWDVTFSAETVFLVWLCLQTQTSAAVCEFYPFTPVFPTFSPDPAVLRLLMDAVPFVSLSPTEGYHYCSNSLLDSVLLTSQTIFFA